MVELTRAPVQVQGFNRGGLSLEPLADLAVVKVRLHAGEDPQPVLAALGAAVPQPGREATDGPIACAGLAPNEWLLTGPADPVAALRDRLAAALQDKAALVVDLSHGRAGFVLSGAGAADALAAHCPLDVSDAAFGPGSAAVSLLGEAGLFISRLADAAGAPRYRLILDQTLARYGAVLLAQT